MEIAIFGGSFDPPHLGHMLTAAWVLLTEPVDELWFVPVFAHPFAKPLAGSFVLRVELCEAAIDSLGLARVKVSRAEASLAGEGRTLDLLEHLQNARPADRFALVMGSDILQETAQWKRFDRITELARIIQVQRKGHELAGLSEAALPEISSTQVRDRLAAGGDLSKLVPRAVLQRIRERGAYGMSKQV